jgi:hypothetical protein
MAPATLPTYTPAQRYLWESQASFISITSVTHSPIWLHPSITIHPLSLPDQQTSPIDLPSDMLSHQLLHWKCKSLVRITALQAQGDTDGSGKEIYDIIGMKPGYPPHPSPPPGLTPKPSHIGTIDPVPAKYGIQNWRAASQAPGIKLHKPFKSPDAKTRKTLDIDLVNEVSLSHDARSIKLSTNRGRSEVFGHETKEEDYRWVSYTAKQGECIVGLSVCFGRLSGWSPGAKMWSHWAVSDVGVMLESVDDEKS